MVRLIASDLDGTLLRSDGSVSERTVEAIGKAQAAGVHVVLVTGRPPRTADSIAHALGVTGPVICCTGALVVEMPDMAVLREHRLDGAIALALVRELREAVSGVCFAWERGLEFGRDPVYHSFANRTFAGVVLGEVDAQAQQGLTKLIVRHPDMDGDGICEATAAVVGSRAYVTTSGAPYAEVHASNATKVDALQWICEELSVDRADVLAIGDGPNDVEMLQWAGRGVAMKNSHPKALAAVPGRTESNDDDGAALLIEGALAVEA